jgi:hypothetical protein
MKDSDYPALYRTSDAASVRAQNGFLRVFRASVVLLILGAIVSLANAKYATVMVVSGLLFLASLAIFVYGQFENFRGRWYQARALAESVKTATWRLIMGADPFSRSTDASLDKYRALLTELLQENKGLAKHLSGQWSNEDQITSEMRRVISMPFEEKRSYYLENRINQQCDWYSKKAESCKIQNWIYFGILCAVYVIAIVLLFVRVLYPTLEYLPVELCAVVASAIISWMQLKKYDELASSYGLTAHEIGIIKSRFQETSDSKKLSGFVCDSENAFSREHTQWAARRDH